MTDNLVVDCGKFLFRPPPNTTDGGNFVETTTPEAITDDAIRRAGIDPGKIRKAGIYQTPWRQFGK